jgi:antitoxin component YwqK of YwqJK toxin-antitoxin module
MRHVIFILFLLPLIAVGQSRKKAKEKAREDSLWQLTVKMMDRYNLDSNGYHNQLTADTIFYDNKKIKAIGSFAVDRNDKKEDYKVGKWMEHYGNGQIKSIGEYQLAFVFVCRSAMPGLAYYSYKIGNWTYYYDNGQIMATGKYDLTTQKVFTGIADQYAKKPIVTDSWQLYNNNGQAITDRQKLIIEIEKFE